MATNRYQHRGRHISLDVAAALDAGTPRCVGSLPCVLTTNSVRVGSTAVYNASVDTLGVWKLTVAATATDVTPGTILYWHTPSTLNNVSSGGTRFGYALDTVKAGESGEIEVRVGY